MKHIINTSLKWLVYGITFMLWIVLVVYASNIALNELWNKTEWDNLTLSMWNSLVANVQDIKTQVDTKANTASPNFTGTPTAPNPPIWDDTTKIATTSWVNAATASASSSSITFSTCSTTDKTQMFYECDPSLAACSTVGAYCGWWKVAGAYGGNIIVSALTDDWKNTWWYANGMNPAIEKCWEKWSFWFDDWQLPSSAEMSYLYTNRVTIWGFNTTDSYWTSDEYTYTEAYYYNFSVAGLYYASKINNLFRIRCIRKY